MNIGAQVRLSTRFAPLDYTTEEPVECISLYHVIPGPGRIVHASATFYRGDLAIILEHSGESVGWCKIILGSGKVGWCEETWLEEIA